MATRSFIARTTDKGFEGVYCHWDGYLEGVGLTLLKEYSDDSQLAQLLRHGDISALGSDCCCTVFYERDHGDSAKHVRTKRLKSLNAMIHLADKKCCEFFYLFDQGIWKFAVLGPESFEPSKGSDSSDLQWIEVAEALN